jgi:hypothetical protein
LFKKAQTSAQAQTTKTDAKQLTTFTSTILKTCASSDPNMSHACYDREIPKLMDSPTNISMEDAFEVTKHIVEQDPTYAHCHVLGHKLSGKEMKKDPSKWKDVITRCPTEMCNNGCLHGSLMERFNTEYLSDAQIEQLKPDLEDVCEPRDSWHPREVERSMCYHALGHLNMYITRADINKSLELCKLIGTKPDGRNYVETCTHGVFMILYQPIEAEDIALVKGKNSNQRNA